MHVSVVCAALEDASGGDIFDQKKRGLRLHAIGGGLGLRVCGGL